MKKIDELLDKYGKQTQAEFDLGHDDCYNEWALYHLLRLFQDNLPELDDRFHKSFRKIDCTGSPHSDMAIWCLLQNAPIFWRIYGETMGQEKV